MSKLHEVLAVETDLDNVFKKVLLEAQHTFGRPEHFIGKHKVYQPFLEEEAHEAHVLEHKDVTTTVAEKMRHVLEQGVNFLNCQVQKSATNQIAVADIVVEVPMRDDNDEIIDGKFEEVTLATDIPATALLGMEAFIRKLRGLVMAVPTLKPGITWKQDSDMRPGVLRNDQTVENLSDRVVEGFEVVVKATEHHPADVRPVKKKVNVGKNIEDEWSGMISSKRKAELLQYIDLADAAVKKARRRANDAEVKKIRPARRLVDFMFTPLFRA